MGKKFRYGTTSLLDILLIAGILVLVNIYSIGSFRRLDLTENQEYTVSNATKKILSQLDDIVNIKVFMSKELPPAMIQMEREIRDLLNEFQTYANQNFQLRYVDPEGNPELEQEAQMAGIRQISLNVVEKDKRTVENIYLSMKIEHANKVEIIEFISPEGLEYEMMSKIVKVMKKESKLPTFGILQGHGEPGTQPANVQQNKPADPMALLVEALRKKFKAFDVKLDDKDQIPSTVDTLVVVNPGSIPDYQLWAIDQFIMNGGKLLCMIDGMELSMTQEPPKPFENGLADLLEHYGLKINPDYVLDNFNANIQYRTGPMSIGVADYPLWIKVQRENFDQSNPITSQLESATFQWCSSIDFIDDNLGAVEKTELVKSSNESWIMDKEFNISPNQDINVVPTGEQFNLGVLLSGAFTSYFKDKDLPVMPKDGSPVGGDEPVKNTSESTEIILFSTSMLAMNDSWSQGRGVSENQNLILNAVDYLSRSEELIGIRSRKSTNRPIDSEVLNDEGKRNMIRWANILAVPVIVILFGIGRFFLREGRKKRFEYDMRLRGE